MKQLFFDAAAGNPKVASALMGAASSTLRPFDRYLRQAIHTAKDRQSRYQLRWERVRAQTITLEPIDTLLRVPCRPPVVILVDWPTGQEFDVGQMAFIINRSKPVRLIRGRRTSSGLEVETDEKLLPDDRLMWCGRESAVRIDEATAPEIVVDAKGVSLEVLHRQLSDGHWLLVVAGKRPDGELMVDEAAVEAKVVRSFDSLQQVADGKGQSFRVIGGSQLHPTAGESIDGETLRGDNHVRYRWSSGSAARGRGCWIQLLSPERSDDDGQIDHRAAFCEGDIDAVWTQARHSPETTFKVKKVDQDRYQLLVDRYPPEGSTLHLPVDVRNLQLQSRALRQLAEAPLPHHQGLLRLCEDPKHVRWPGVRPVSVADDRWRSLKDATRSGTDEQRAFVRKALGSDDFAFLEGPPGSGKTTAICEIVQQLVEQGKRILLCASTHVAIDNVLERLLGSGSPIDAVRIGKIDKVDDRVQATQLEERVTALVSSWRSRPEMRALGNELEAMAERTVIMAANLTCGTTMGIVNHPFFQGRDTDLKAWERPITTMPHWDVLIIDEASKTLIQEFMVPALMAKKWIIVGDIRQLPPFSDRDDIVANLRELVGDNDRVLFSADHQRACLLLFRLLRGRLRQQGMRWLFAEPPGVLDWITKELGAAPEPGLSIVRVLSQRGRAASSPVPVVTVAQLVEGTKEALLVAAADWVLIDESLLPKVAHVLPSNLLLVADPGDRSASLNQGSPFLHRQAWWLRRAGQLPTAYQDRNVRSQVGTFEASQACEIGWLARHDLAQELAWRLTRLHELRRSRNTVERARLQEDIDSLLPKAISIQEPVEELQDIGLPSILEVLQEGVGVDRTHRHSALTAGLRRSRTREFDERFQSLSYQHRMHSAIASFSRDLFYEGSALKDANTIKSRDLVLGWDFRPLEERRVWMHVLGNESNGENHDERDAIKLMLQEFIDWARIKGPPADGQRPVWEVACLSFYAKQDRAVSEMLRGLTSDDRRTRFQVPGAPVEIVCGTVDRFQGREADLVMLSMRNTNRVGFLDSPNRLNVALTRARQKLIVFGNAGYFGRCRVSELEELVARTPRCQTTARPHRGGLR